MASSKKPTMREIGGSGLQIYSGYVTEGDDYLVPDLIGREALLTYKRMDDNDPILGAMMFAIKMLMRQVTWRVDPASPSAKHIEDAEFVESCMNDMSTSWSEFISEACTMFPYGWALHEINYKYRRGLKEDEEKSSKYNDGMLGWASMPLRGQSTIDKWDIEEGTDRVRGFFQRPFTDFKLRYLPRRKYILFRTQNVKGNPEGRSIYRNAYEPWFFKSRIQRIEGVGIERDLAGLPMAEVDPAIMAPNATEEDKALYNTIKTLVRNIRRDAEEGIVWPMEYDDNNNQMYKLTLLNSGGSRQFDTSVIIERYVKHMVMTSLADFILLGHEATGSFALSSNKTNLFSVALGGWLTGMGDDVNRQAVRRLYEANPSLDQSEMCTIKHDDIETPDLTAIAAIMGAMVAAGLPLFPDDELESWLRSVVGMPPKGADANPELPPGMQSNAEQSMAPGTNSDQPGQEPRTSPEVDYPDPPDTSSLGKVERIVKEFRAALSKAPRDGDGDGFVNDGPRQTPVSPRNMPGGKPGTKRTARRKIGGRRVAAGEAKVRRTKEGKQDKRNISQNITTGATTPDGEPADNGQFGRAFEDLLVQKCNAKISNHFGVPVLKGNRINGNGGMTTTPIDVGFGDPDVPWGHLFCEVKTIHVSAKEYKACISNDAMKKKIAECKKSKAKPVTIIQVVDQENGRVKVFLMYPERSGDRKKFNFYRFRVGGAGRYTKVPDFEYTYTDGQYSNAYRKAARNGGR